jgi:small-conductance mechanosensitive channel
VPAEAHSPSEAGVAADPPARPATEVEIQRLEQQIAALQMQLDEARQVQRDADARWQGQLEDTSGLIKALADQNATLVQQTELQQRRLQSLTWGVVIGGLVLAAGLVALAVRVPGVLPG